MFMASWRDNLKVYLRVTEKKSVSQNPKSSKKQKTASVEENIDQKGKIRGKSTMKQQTSRKRKEISDNGNFIYFFFLNCIQITFNEVQ
ncbi:hypothetical protein Hanom_Chr07g00629021 [Helianthus anomalus]